MTLSLELLIKILIKYPSKEEEIRIIEKNTTDKITKVEPILKSNEILQMQEFNSKIYADNIILKYG